MAPTFRRVASWGGAAVAVFSFATVALALVLAASGKTPPGWMAAVVLYGLPLAFACMGAALVAAFLERRKR
ncbi:hypothetical protein [Sinomonas terrae]|jgi:FtsH-binding integral membrane protein|uniref:Multidrug ABC transporter ATPase n=1 Tax=Sinomonas terrae TaxID=2908838 RepID=A0ABS9U419_9MICC|nr:hypothetical protein [Sinomonas terrae]MCH6471444.1 hypothetical protein [Sinomonas terrae]